MTESSLKSRVEGRLKALQLNPFEAARRAGLGRDFVNDIIGDRKRSVRGDNLAALATALECDVAYLAGEQAAPIGFPLTEASPINVRMEVAAGVWKDPVARSSFQQYPSLLSPDLRYKPTDQFDVVVGDGHVSSFARQGQKLRLVRDMVARNERYFNELHLVERRNGSAIEYTIRRLVRKDKEAVWVFESDDPRYAEVISANDTYDELGIVLFVYDIPNS